MDINAVRASFPMLHKTMHGQPLVYFDSAATAQKPQIVIDTITDYYREHCGTVHRAIYELAAYATHHYQETRTKVQTFINAAVPEEIIFTRGTTDSINLVAASFGKAFIQPGDEIIISQMEHHANIVPWQIMANERKAILRIIPFDAQGELLIDEYQKLLNPKVKIVAVTHVSNVLGTINPIKEICSMAHACGAKVLVDGAQAVPHLKVDVQDLDADFYAFSGHKLYGPTGIGVLYGKKELLELMPPYQGGGDMIELVTFEKTTYNTLPLKFEAGTPMIGEVLGLGAAIDYVQSIGYSAIANHEHALMEYLTPRLLAIPNVRIFGAAPHKGAIHTFEISGIHPLDLGSFLDFQGIAIRTGGMCAHPIMKHYGVDSAARLSLAFYNTFEEIDCCIAALHKAITYLKR
jgi:cysteine desulfurase/selenocysteine lyase